MTENVKQPIENVNPQDGDDFAAPDLSALLNTSKMGVTVGSGLHFHNLPLQGKTVGEARQIIAERIHIEPGSTAVLDGAETSDNTKLSYGQLLTFVKHSGEKGMRTCDKCHA